MPQQTKMSQMSRFGHGVLVANPVQQHSHQLALALANAGMLRLYLSGVPVLDISEHSYKWIPIRFRKKIKVVSLKKEIRKHCLLVPAMLRFSSYLPGFVSTNLRALTFSMFDRWTASIVRSLQPDVVVAYESTAYHTFHAAKTVGALCILDSSTLHPREIVGIPGLEGTYPPKDIIHREKVIEMADIILTCSPIAKNSFLTHSVPEHKLREITLGSEVPKHITGANAPKNDIPRFVFVGGIRRLKAIDSILEAFRRINDAGLEYELFLVGDIVDQYLLESIKATPHLTHIQSVPQLEVYKIMAAADCLLLPSKFDSFGMVVPESLACGTPVLVSEAVGAKCIIQRHPKAGWIVDLGTEPLFEKVSELIRDRSLLRDARKHAKLAASNFGWDIYRQKVTEIIASEIQKRNNI